MDGNGGHDDLEVVDLADRIEQLTEREALIPPSARIDVRSTWSRIRIPMAVLLAVLAVWGYLAYRTVVTVEEDVTAARDTLLEGRDVLVAGEVAEAEAAFAEARDSLATVPDRLSGLSTLPVRVVPFYRRTLDGVSDLARASEVAAAAAASVSGELAGQEGGLGALTPREGRIPVGALEDIAPVLAAAATDLTDAAEMTRSVPTTGLHVRVADARQELLDVLGPTADSLALGAQLTEKLPLIFGADEPRRYMVLASNPTENRGTGGFYGAYTVLEADGGELSFSPVAETLALPQLDEGEIEWADPSLDRRFDLYGGTRSFRNINMTADFPAAAATIVRFFEAGTGQSLDGVIAVDPFAFEALLRLTGPVELPGYGQIAADDVVEFVSRSAYREIDDPVERKTLIGQVATAALQGFLSGAGDVSPSDVIEALSGMAERDSLQLHSVHPDEQQLLLEGGLAGDFTNHGGDLLAVILNSGTGSKVDYFLERVVRYDVDLGPDGLVTGTVAAGFTNTAPTEGEPAYMIGLPPPDAEFPSTGVVPVGTNRSFVSIYCGPGCRFFEVPDSGLNGLPTQEQVELGFPVTSTWIEIPSGQSRELIFSYTSPEAWTSLGGDRIYDLRYAHQTSIIPIQLDISVGVPEGFEVSEMPEGAEVVDGRVVWQEQAIADADYRIRFTPT